MKKNIIFFVLLLIPVLCQAEEVNKAYSLWYQRPAFNRGGDYNKIVARGFPYDEDWERWSLPIGNGYMGANIFGRTDIERIQLSEKTMSNKGCHGLGGFTNFAEIYLDINHNYAKGYKRELGLNDAVSTVSYECEGVNYTREYIANYPNNVIAVKLKADKPGSISFRLRPILPYLHSYNDEKTGRTGTVVAEGNLITMQGNVQYFNLAYECQVKVLNYGGSLKAENDKLKGTGLININHADSVVLLITAGTSYQLKDSLFLLPPAEKCKGNEHPHDQITERISKATAKGYDVLRKEHVSDYQQYFNRADISFTDKVPNIPTDKLLSNYKAGKHDPYLEELFFQYGRYLLISSSREGALPPNLQGAWNQYEYAPWSGGYWHNINVQMNFWPAFNTNLAELFVPFVKFNEAYRKAAMRDAAKYIKKNNPEALDSAEGENGWAIGTASTPYAISAPGGHSGPGTGGFTTKLYWDYYDFTRDESILENHTYPALLGMAKFLSKTLKSTSDGKLLAYPSSSPEQRHNGVHYQTKGCTFDQGMIWENYRDLLDAAKVLKKKDSFLKKIEDQMGKLDPILVGESGQIKEYREEKKFDDIGDPRHRHISHLCPLYPGTAINETKPEWFDAARVSLKKRGYSAGIWNGWPMAHRLNAWARLKNGNEAYAFYQIILTKGVTENLWGLCPPFQIDSNFGGTAGVAEMLLQSHEGYIEPLPALPDAWKDGSFRGLVGRGNFEVSANWQKGKAQEFKILSRKGEVCRMKYAGITHAKVVGEDGKVIKFRVIAEDRIEFKTKKGINYLIKL
jgi:alpha-L-fucosidase 2